MRGERRGFIFDQSLLGRGRRGGRDLVPLDRLELARHRSGEHLVHARDRDDLEPALDAVRNLGQILFVVGGDDHGLDAGAQSRKQLLLQIC